MPFKNLGVRAIFPLLACLCLPAVAGNFKGATVSSDQTYMVIHTSSGDYNAPTIKGQVGFDSPRVSGDGKYIGWLALYSNDSASYPIPMDLVVMDRNGTLEKFDGTGLAIFDWCFLPDSKSVAFKFGPLHFTDDVQFEWRSLKGKRLLGKYEYPDDYDVKPKFRANDARAKAVKNAPAWVKCVPQ